MKHFLLVGIIGLGLLAQAMAQNKFDFSFKAGLSLPTGEYSSQDIEKGAFTTIGMSLGADAVWYFYKNLGVVADFNYSLHSVDAVAIATETLYASEDPFLNDLFVRSDPYKVFTFNAGLVYNYQLLARLSLEPGFMAGLMMAYTPFQLYEAEYFLLPNNYFKKTTSRDENFAFKTGLAVKYDISSCLKLKLSGEYTYGKMNFGFTNSNGPYIQELKISYLDIGLGLVFKLK
jgi:opacity protein-like surface antigen